MNIQRCFTATAVALSLSFNATFASIGSATAQTWPTRSVKFIVSVGPGSGTDISARLLADRLTARWGQPVIVENRPGGDAVVAIRSLIDSRDGHTLLFSPASSITAYPYQQDKLPYDPRDLLPIARLYNTVVGFAVSPGLNIRSVADLIALIRAQPGKLNYSTGTGMTDLICEGYFKSAGLDITRVPYRDVVSPMIDLGEGRIQAYVAGLPNMLPQIQAGRANLIAVTNGARASTHPNVPTVAQAGFPALTFDGLVGVFGQRDMAPSARERVASDIRAVLAEPAVAMRLNNMGAVVNPGDAAEFAASLEEQSANLAEIARVLGIRPNSQ
jgi:tripartite-type tricarboxylate transporter receptor subunit TctC